MKTYRAFGLEIVSDLDIPEFVSSIVPQEKIDVQILSKEIPRFLNHALHSNRLQADGRKILIHIENVARFLIEGGTSIFYEPCPGSDPDTLRLFLLGSCMGALLQQRGLIVLHGNSVSLDGRSCKVFVGYRGAGKSTMAGWYYRQGAFVLADDISAIAFFADGRPYVIPSFPQIKLWQESLDLLKINSHLLRRVRPETAKFALPLKDQYCAHPLPVSEILEIGRSLIDDFEINGLGKMNLLMRHTYRIPFLRKMGLMQAYSKELIKLATQTAMKKTHRMDLNQLPAYAG
jgi:hypothetical protein